MIIIQGEYPLLCTRPMSAVAGISISPHNGVMFHETTAQAWKQRFGTEPPEGLPNLGRLLNHRSVRQFSSRPVSLEAVQGLVAAAQSAATSSNLQLWTVVSVQDPERRLKVAQLAGDQEQIRQAAWFFVFLADHYRLKSAAAAHGEECAGMDYNEFFTMAVVDVALAAERMVCAAEHLGLGTCYIGAVRNDVWAMREFLELPDSVFPVFGLCIGYPAETCTAEVKPRLGQPQIWHRERYDREVQVQEYDARMSGFYESQQMKGEVTWSMRSGRRVNGKNMTGREILKPFLEAQGFDRR